MQTNLIFRRLTTQEVAVTFPRRGQMDLSDYEEIMQGLEPGDAAEVALGDLTSRAMKRRLGSAARKVLNATLKYKIFEDRIMFQVRPPTKTRMTVRSFTPARRRGRPSKLHPPSDPASVSNGVTRIQETPIIVPEEPQPIVEQATVRPKRTRRPKVTA